MVNVHLGAIQTGAWSENAGIFTGQNIQNSWDSHSPAITTSSVLMGDFNIGISHISWLYTQNVHGQPTFDQDVKGNASMLNMR
jgi:hypothetical protein